MFIGILGCFLLGVMIFNVDTGVFTERILWLVQPRDIMSGLFKALVFGFIISSLSCRYGLRAVGGAKGVGKATTDSVIAALLFIFISDVIITFFQVIIL